MSQSEQQGNSILSVPSHGQSNDASQPSIFTPVADAFNKMRAPLVEAPLPVKK